MGKIGYRSYSNIGQKISIEKIEGQSQEAIFIPIFIFLLGSKDNIRF